MVESQTLPSHNPSTTNQSPSTLQTDVLIVGSGSAGLLASLWLSRLNISHLILERSTGPLQRGQADGVQCRTVEVYASFGLSSTILDEAYHVLEDTFWGEDGKGGLQRLKVEADSRKGLSHLPHLILNQARMNGVLLEAAKKWGGGSVEYGVKVDRVEVDKQIAESDEDSYAASVYADKDGEDVVYKAKYVLGCDGAHSVVRKSLGFKMVGDSSDAVWGVMDVYPQTNFPDIRKKVVLQTSHGNLLIIPREGGSLARFYIQLPAGTKAKEVKLEVLQETARKIFEPFTMEFADTYWWSAYPIGQRVADFFSKDNRVFLTGDACHTHSPKAGQGMNTSLQDGYNIGWKLAAVLLNRSPPSLLQTYVLEREKVARKLIAFDKELTDIWARNESGDHREELVKHFLKSAEYTAGLTARYDESCITAHGNSEQTLAQNLAIGMRVPSTQVVRFCDAKAVQFVDALPSDGRWRIITFTAGSTDVVLQTLDKLSTYLTSQEGPIAKYTPRNADIDSVIETIVVVSGDRYAIEQSQIPEFFWPITGKHKMRDLHKIYFDTESYNSGHGHAYDFYGVDPDVGALVIVRPDQYVSLVTGLDNRDSLGNFFDGFLLPCSHHAQIETKLNEKIASQ